MGHTLMVGRGTGYATDFPSLFPEPRFFHGLIIKMTTVLLTPIILFSRRARFSRLDLTSLSFPIPRNTIIHNTLRPKVPTPDGGPASDDPPPPVNRSRNAHIHGGPRRGSHGRCSPFSLPAPGLDAILPPSAVWRKTNQSPHAGDDVRSQHRTQWTSFGEPSHTWPGVVVDREQRNGVMRSRRWRATYLPNDI